MPNLGSLAYKMAHGLSMPYKDIDFGGSLVMLDSMRVYDNLGLRRQLRLQAHKSVIDCNHQLVTDFGSMADHLRRLGSMLDRLTASFADMKARAAVDQDDLDYIHQGKALLAQHTGADVMQKILHSFMCRFILTEDEIVTITDVEQPIGDKFFAIFSKVKRNSQDCETLLALEHQTLGLDIMAQAAKHLTAGYQKLSHWIQHNLKEYDTASVRIDPCMRTSLLFLSEQPALFHKSLEIFIETREALMTASFNHVLTGTSTNKSLGYVEKPLDMTAHDPIRYMGDILAWIHTAVVGELEVLQSLFIPEGDSLARQSSPPGTIGETLWPPGSLSIRAADLNKTLCDLTDQCLVGVSKILHDRVSHVIGSVGDLVIAYRSAKLFHFYRSVFSQLLSRSSSFAGTIEDAQNESLQRFQYLLREHTASVQTSIETPSTRLHPPNILRDSLLTLESIMDSCQIDVDMIDELMMSARLLVQELLDPVLKACEDRAAVLNGPRDQVYLFNCYTACKLTVSRYKLSCLGADQFSVMIVAKKARLARFQHRSLRLKAGFDDIFKAARELDTKTEITDRSCIPRCLDPVVVSEASRLLDRFLTTALIDSYLDLEALADLTSAREISETAANAFLEDYRHLEECLMSLGESLGDIYPKDEQSLRLILPRSSIEVKVLLL
jgi:hypothetical protein